MHAYTLHSFIFIILTSKKCQKFSESINVRDVEYEMRADVSVTSLQTFPFPGPSQRNINPHSDFRPSEHKCQWREAELCTAKMPLPSSGV